MKKIVALVLALLMVISTSALAEPITVTDMYGRSFTLDKPVTRIVALTAADCEILCALGAEDVLVGRGEYCDSPASIQDVPVVQSGFDTNIEELLVLEPEVVIMGDMNQAKEMVDMIEQNGIHVVVSNADSIEGTFTAIRTLGTLLGKNAEADALIADMQSTFDAVSAKNEDSGKTIYFEVSPLQWGLWAAGKNTFMDELAAMCGLTNIFADVDGWGAVSEEQVLARDPDYIVTITMYYGEGPTPVEEILSRPGWENLKAVKEGHVFMLNSDAASRPGPRLRDAALELDGFINP